MEKEGKRPYRFRKKEWYMKFKGTLQEEKKYSNKDIISKIMETDEKIFGDKTSYANVVAFKKTTLEKILAPVMSIEGVRKSKTYTFSLDSYDEIFKEEENEEADHDTIIESAVKLQKEKEGLSREEAVKETKKKVHSIKPLIPLAVKLLNSAELNREWRVEFQVLKSLGLGTKQKVMAFDNRMKNFGINFGIKYVNPTMTGFDVLLLSCRSGRQQLEKVAQNKYGMNIEGKIKSPIAIRREPENKDLDWHTILFYVVGILDRNGGRLTDIKTVTGILNNNNYRKFGITYVDIQTLVKTYPDIIQINSSNHNYLLPTCPIDQARRMVSKYNPATIHWNLYYVIKSGLSIDRIHELFPNASVMSPEGDSPVIVNLRTTYGIKNLRNLMKFQDILRDEDYPLGIDKGYIERLNEGRKRLQKIFDITMEENFSEMRILAEEDQGNFISNNRLLCKIEEG